MRRIRVLVVALVSVMALAGGASRCGAPEGSGGHMWNVINPSGR